MNKIKKMFNKIKKYFMKMFNKQEIKLIKETTIITNDIEFEINNFVESETDKKDFFIIYKNVKNGVIKPEELMINDLIKVQLMMQSELDCINEKIRTTEDEIMEMNYEIANLKKENKIYKEKLKNIN